MTEPVLDAEVVEEPSTEVVPAAPGSLFRTDDPLEVIGKATEVATALKRTVSQAGLIANVQGKEYPTVGAWQTLGAMLGITSVCTWTRPLANGWEARVEARTLDGRVVGAAEAECTTDEKSWAKRDSYALRSMAQTRATSKALRGPLGFVMNLAGLEATPAEEMPRDLPRREPEQTGRPDIPVLPEERVKEIEAKIRAKGLLVADVRQLLGEADVWIQDGATLAACKTALVYLTLTEAEKVEELLS